jgi:CRISPR-associated protein Cmr1
MRRRADTPPEITMQPATVIRQERKYQLITPLYGGGVTPAEPDPITVVRATEIRGHLRFWWRAYHAAQFADLPSLKKAEDKLWGAAAKKEDEQNKEEQDSGQNKKEEPQPTIQIEVKIDKPGIDIDAYSVVGRTDENGEIRYQVREKWPVPLYAAFPLQPTQEELNTWDPSRNRAKKVRDGVIFTLIIVFPMEKKDEVEAALWAWETFGGIGARTRRGFGALRLLSINGKGNIDLPNLNTQTAEDWIKVRLKKLVVSGIYPRGMPRLTPTTQFTTRTPARDAKAIWNDLIKQLKDFRQLRQPTGNPNHPGRSIWPEPTEIRRVTKQSLPAHANPIPDPPIHKFPRAVFGLPVIFQFKDRDKRNYPDNPHRDPRNTVLRLDISERLASPLILKPLACQNGKYVELAVILDGTGMDEDRLILKMQGTERQEYVKYKFESTESLVVGEDSRGIPISIDSNTNALQAFLEYLERM